MKNLIAILISICLAISSSAQTEVCFTVAFDEYPFDCNNQYCSSSAPFTFSKGIYRIPYLEFTGVHVDQDAFSSCPRGTIDLQPIGSENLTYYVVAAADGWLRKFNDNGCIDPSACTGWIWMEHPNGEWTFYQHIETGSIPDDLQHDDWVTAGTVIGEVGYHLTLEDTTKELTFAVAVPVDTDAIYVVNAYGSTDGDFSDLRVPLFCGESDHQLKYHGDYTALSCSGSCNDVLPILGATFTAGDFKVYLNDDAVSTDNITVEEASSVVIQSTSSVTLSPGFQAGTNSTVQVRAGECNGAGLNKNVSNENADAIETNTFSVNPNPASNSATLHWVMNKDGSVIISVCDMERRELSRPVYSEQMNSGTHEQMIDVSTFPSGVYLVLFELNQEIQIQKLVVQR